MARTADILGRVLRNLRRFGITTSDVTDEEVYDELSQSQNRIISEVQPGKILTVTLVTDQDSYTLSTDSGSITRYNIAELKLLKFPSDWLYRFELIPNKEYVERINVNRDTTISQPVIGSVIDEKLKIFPSPTSSFNGDELEFWVSLKSSTQDIDENMEPELPNVWDKALEWDVTAQFLKPKDARDYIIMFQEEVKRLRPTMHRNNHPLQRENAFDLLPVETEILRTDVWE